MSATSSGASTPRATTPPAEGPSPLVVGTRFVKQYYKVLSTEPSQIVRFYQPSSVWSVGIGSAPTTTAGFETLQESVKTRFVAEGYEAYDIRFEFEHGAIDAQVSIGGGVLLVVTGHVVYEKDEEEERRKAFVHTFFLSSMQQGAKRSYYVHNDILRFLNDDEEKTVVVSNTTVAKLEVQLPTAVEEPPVEVVSTPEGNEAPGGGVEETKETTVLEQVEEVEELVAMDEEKVVIQAVVQEKKPVTKKEEQPVPAEEEAKASAPKVPGSWASLVAGAGGSPPPTPTRPTPAKKPVPTTPKTATNATKPAATPPTPSTPAADKPAERQTRAQHAKRDPDCTLVIKNITADTKELDVIGLFETYAAKSESKVVGVTVSVHKGIAFIDYDSAAPVVAVVEQHSKEPFQLHGKVLDLYQKTHENRHRNRSAGGRGSFRGGPPGNGSSFRGGGRQQFRRVSGRGDRGGGSSGRGGRGGR